MVKLLYFAMTHYFSTFITGFAKVVEKALIASLKDVEIDLLTDGLVLYKTKANISDIKKLKFLNNSFVLIKKFDKVSADSISSMIKDLCQDKTLGSVFTNYFAGKKLAFRIRAAVANQFVGVDKNLVANLEKALLKVAPHLTVNRSLADIELLILVRSEGFGLAGVQFTKRPNYEKTLAKGELYPELAYLMCLLSEPAKDDIFFDPFAGYGALPAQRLTLPYTKILAGETDKALRAKLSGKFGKKVTVVDFDALNLRELPDNTLAKIITDPPWGHFVKQDNLPQFYFKMLSSLTRVLKPGGLLVILTAQKELLTNTLAKFVGKLQLEDTIATLVSGKKAGVFILKKTSPESS